MCDYHNKPIFASDQKEEKYCNSSDLGGGEGENGEFSSVQTFIKQMA